MPRKKITFALVLLAVTLALYWPVHGFDLVYWDDPQVMTDCPASAGLTWPGLKWALTAVVIANWHPLTNLSFITVAEFFGHTPGAQHLANALIHSINAALLFLLLVQLTGATWRSAVAAAIFAWHPQRVESVAWIIERKDVLCGFFVFLSLIAYAKFSKMVGNKTNHSKFWFHSSLLAFAGALLSKPMAVTLPFVLLLLDIWPLRRFTIDNFQLSVFTKLVREKTPFFALMILFCIATYWIQRDYAAMTPWEKLGLAPRVANAITGYLAYPTQLLWPTDFAAIYPFQINFDTTEVTLKALLLLFISIGCFSQIKKHPSLTVGWLWYLGTALPIIGFVQVGEQSMADRYTYLPLIGPVVALVWTASEFFLSRRAGKTIFKTSVVLILATLLVLSARQIQFWRNTIALFTHNIEVTPDNGSAHFTLGLGYEHAGDLNRATVCYRVAKKLSPGDAQIRSSLACLLTKQNHWSEAETEYRELLAMNEADFATHNALANVLAAQGRDEESLAQLNESVRLNPDCVETLNNLAWALTASPHPELRDGLRAVTLAQRACELSRYEKTMFIGTLAAAQAEAGKFEEAIATAQKACALASKNRETNLLQSNQELLELYRAHKPARTK